MRKLFVIALFACYVIAGWAQENNYTVSCDITPVANYFIGTGRYHCLFLSGRFCYQGTHYRKVILQGA